MLSRWQRLTWAVWLGVGLAPGCSRSYAAPPAVTYSPASTPQATRFAGAVSAFREQVQLMKVTPSAGPMGPGVRRAMTALSDAVDSMPQAHGVDVTDAARTMREDLPENIGDGQWSADTATTQLRGALQVAAGAFFLLSRGPYDKVPGLPDRVEALRQAADAIEPQEPIAEQQPAVLAALSRAGDALSAFEWAAGIASPPVARAGGEPGPSLGLTEAQGARSSAFATALSSYSVWVDRFASLPPERQSPALRRAMDALADAVAAMPHRDGLAPSETAAQMHRLASDFQSAPALSGQQATIARHVFERAEAILALTARREYAGRWGVADAVRALRLQYVTIDKARPLRSQLHESLGSLAAAERVLREMAMASAAAAAR